jgi:hypothetical protein
VSTVEVDERSRARRGGTGWLTDSDSDEWGADGKEVIELGSASAALVGVGGRTRTRVDTESEGSGVVGGLARVRITPEDGGST